MRKSPRRHHVKSYKRKGFIVRDYMRGKGTRTTPTFTRRKSIKTDKPKSYTVNFRYSNKKGDGESVVVISTSYDKALKESFQEKHDPREPIEIEIVDPSVGKALRILARGAAQITKLGAKYTYVAGKTVAKEAAFAIARAYRRQKVRRLIEESYSPDRATRAMARARLRTQYPEIYAVCDFSREGPRKRWVRAVKETIR